MDYIRIFRRALEITWIYKALWVFGFIIALTTAHGGGGNGGGGGGGGGGSSFVAPSGVAKIWAPPVQNIGPTEMAVLLVLLGLIILVFGVIFTVARYVSETAVIRMVNEFEESGRRVSVADGFGLGWNRAAFRLFLIDLIFILGAVLVIGLLLAVALLPMLGLTSGNDTLEVIGSTVSVGLLVLLALVIILVVAALTVLLRFFHRAAVLETLGVFPSIRRGWEIVRARPGDVVIIALILFGLGLASAIVFLPVVFILLMLGMAVGGLPALVVGLIASLFMEGAAPWLVGALIGVPLFLLVLVLPLLFVSGLVEVFTSSTWTLTYREVLALEGPG